jgi:hypothetical protein
LYHHPYKWYKNGIIIPKNGIRMGIDPWPFLDRLLLLIFFISVETHLPKNPWFCLDGKNTGKDSSQLEHQLFPTNISIEHGHRRVDLPIYYERGNGVVNHYEPF